MERSARRTIGAHRRHCASAGRQPTCARLARRWQNSTPGPRVVLILTYVVGPGSLAHVIAGSVETLFVTASGLASPATWVGWFVPTLVGNIIGGVSLVAALNHAQVVSGWAGAGQERLRRS